MIKFNIRRWRKFCLEHMKVLRLRLLKVKSKFFDYKFELLALKHEKSLNYTLMFGILSLSNLIIFKHIHVFAFHIWSVFPLYLSSVLKDQRVQLSGSHSRLKWVVFTFELESVSCFH